MAMTSIVEELEREALNSSSSLSDLLRKARVIASKLNLQQPTEWVESELNGYTGEVPDYRVVSGEAKFKNPFHGWLPVLFGDARLQSMVCDQKIPNPVRELEHFMETIGEIRVDMSGQQSQMLCQMANIPTFPVSVFIPKNSILRVLDIVRTKILDWSLSLQAAGIKGEGLSFSATEKAAAQNPNVTYQIGYIGNFSGNLGGNVGRDVNVASPQAVGAELARVAELIKQIRSFDGQMGLSPALQAELRAHVEALDAELQKKKAEPGKISGLLKSVKAIAEGVAGNVVAAGIVALASSIHL